MTEQRDNLLQCQYCAQTEEMKQQPGRIEERAANNKQEERPSNLK